MGGVIVFGAGGHGRVVIDALQSLSDVPRCVVVDADPGCRGQLVLGVPVAGADDCLPELQQQGFDSFVIAIGGLRQFALRRRLFDRAVQLGLQPLSLRHPTAVCSRHARLRAGVQLLAGSIVNPQAEIGENSIINSAAIVEHDCRVGRHVHLAPRACLAGGVVLGDEVHIGAGAVVRDGIRVGDRAVVGLGAAVVRDVPPDAVVVGIPAREIRRSNE